MSILTYILRVKYIFGPSSFTEIQN